MKIKTRKHKKSFSLYAQKLKKQRGARLPHVETLRITCASLSSIKENTSSWLTAKESLKIPDEAMYDEFVHIIKGVIKDKRRNTKNNSKSNDNAYDIVVKMQEPDRMAIKERKALEFFKDKKTPNIVQYICSFSCYDNKKSFETKIEEPVGFCKGDNESELFEYNIIEYIPKNISHVLHSDISTDIFESIIKQLGFVFLHTYIEYGFIHGDIHSGNILVDIDIPKVNRYKILDYEYSINTLGYEPKLIDFQRGHFKPNKNINASFDSVQIDLSLLFDILSRQNKKYKKSLEKLSLDITDAESLNEIIGLVNRFNLQ